MDKGHKSNLQRDYTQALENLKNKEYDMFFRNIRPAIEVFSKVIIFEMMGDSQARKLLLGQMIVEDGKLVMKQGNPVEGGNLMKTIPEILPIFLNTKGIKGNTRARIKNTVERNCAKLSDFYSVASALGSHAGESALNIELQAISHSFDLPSFLDSLVSASILTKVTIEELKDIIKPLQWATGIVDDISSDSHDKMLSDLEKKLKGQDDVIAEHKAKEAVAQQNALEAERKALEAEQKILEIERTAFNEMRKAEDASKRLNEVNLRLSEIKEKESSLRQENENLLQMNEALVKDKKEQDTIIAELRAQVEALKSGHKPDDSISIDTNVTSIIPASRPKDFDVKEDDMDDDQLDLIDKTLDKSMLVAGCAGCGKSVIAIHKAQQIRDNNGDYIMIAYTKSLNNYMNGGKSDSGLGKKLYYHWQWENAGKPSADYIIVDEIQDFTESEIKDFVSAARKCFFFFGDTAQSIYSRYGRPTMSVEEISKMTGLDILFLHNNYRLPKGIAQVTQDYIGVGVKKFDVNTYKSKERTIPYFLPYQTNEQRISDIISIVNRKKMKNVGILVPSNDIVLELHHAFDNSNFYAEFKYSKGKSDAENVDTLDFSTDKPKLMTFHSAKGLQFEHVFIPMCKSISKDEDRKALYVAMTRTYKNLFIMYTGDTLPKPLDSVPAILYKTTLQ